MKLCYFDPPKLGWYDFGHNHPLVTEPLALPRVKKTIIYGMRINARSFDGESLIQCLPKYILPCNLCIKEKKQSPSPRMAWVTKEKNAKKRNSKTHKKMITIFCTQYLAP